MTAIIAIIVKERRGKPFILVASDSKRSHTSHPNSGETLASVENNAKKIFKFNNKFMAIAGSFRPTFQINLFEKFKAESKHLRTSTELTEFFKTNLKKYVSEESEKVLIEIMFGMIENNKPIVFVMSYFWNNALIKIEKFESTEDNAELIRAGEIVPLNVFGRLKFYEYSPIEMRGFAKTYISKATEMFPESCNDNLQSELII